MSNDQNDLVFDQSQIGKGVKPLAQHGKVVVGGDGTLSLFGSEGQLIDSAPAAEVAAKRAWYTGGQTVMLNLQGRKYNTTPGWGNRPGAVGGELGKWGGVVGTSSASKALVKAIELAKQS
jgi:hypothetical protein